MPQPYGMPADYFVHDICYVAMRAIRCAPSELSDHPDR
jgi:hypothetical protein